MHNVDNHYRTLFWFIRDFLPVCLAERWPAVGIGRTISMARRETAPKY